MKKIYPFIIILLLSQFVFSQGNFKFSTDKKKISIPFQLANNLIIVPVELNGVKLNFLLDTGVEKTILFSLEEIDSVHFHNVEKIKIRGLGSGKSIDAFHAMNNKLELTDFIDVSHELYIIMDQDVNFSSHLGIPVHGILGYHFFKDHFIEINYKTKKITIYKEKSSFPKSKLRVYDEIPISIELDKPYINVFIGLNSKKENVKLLVDTGGSDAIWLFEDEKIKCPENYFDDFLGSGFSGDVFGKRSRIESMVLGKSEISFPTISFPNQKSIQFVNLVEGRNGSVGSEILKRFNVLFDYANNKMYIKKNSDFSNPFNYNMSGMEVQHGGLQWVKEEIELKTSLVESNSSKTEINLLDNTAKSVKYQFSLKPKYEVTSVRKMSPADLAGIKKGDIIQKLNGNNAFKYTLHDIIYLMQSEEGKVIKLELERNGVIIKTKFQLKKIL